MAQLVARLVRNEKVGGSNPPSSTTGRHPIADVGFLYAWARWCGACRCVACGAAGVPGAPLCCFVGPCRCVCRWVAARPIDGAACSPTGVPGAGWPGQDPLPPTGTAAGPSGPSSALHTSGAWLLMCGSVCRFEARPGPAAAHGHHSLAPSPPTGMAGNSRETVITFAGVCSVSGETDDTIASQIHLFSAQFWRAKASWVSWRRTEAPAMGLTVSSCGAVSRMGTTKFAQRRLSMAIARDYSPSTGKVVQNERFMACWASFFAEMARMASRWANYFASVGGWGVCWASFSRPPAP